MIAILAACSGDPHGGRKHPDPVAFTDEVEAQGFAVGEGRFETVDYDGCCLPGVSCLWNNASTPYGVYVVPPSPSEPATTDGGLLQSFHLRSDEALVYLGRTPPEAKYFSWRSYVYYRWVDGVQTPVLGSLGPSLNDLVVAHTQGPDHVFDEPLAIVTTADAALERKIERWLVEAGWDPTHIYADQLPYGLLRMGLAADADTFSVVSRSAVFADPAAGEAWRADAGAVVLRLTPPGDEQPPAEPFAPQPLPAMGAGTDEEGWRDAVERLQTAILTRYPALTGAVSESNDFFFETYTCLGVDYCSGEIRDRYYARVPSVAIPDDGSFAVAFGVNHERTGKASYANVTVETVENQIGLEAVESDRFVGSARSFLPGDPQVDDLYAVVIARSCAGFDDVPCIEVPTACPGVPLEDPLVIDFRAYLEPGTGAAPLGAEILHDRAIKFFPPVQ